MCKVELYDGKSVEVYESKKQIMKPKTIEIRIYTQPDTEKKENDSINDAVVSILERALRILNRIG